MRRNKLYPIVALLASALTAEAGAQSLADIQTIKPVVMLLVDTSGSMERLPNDPSAAWKPESLPVCGSSDPALRKNRWAITLEVLTGSFQDFDCEEQKRTTKYQGEIDEDYFLPHFAVKGTQVEDGVLDYYSGRIKFGMMTFDGVLTTATGATLVPFSSYSSVSGQVNGRTGMYSYPATTADANNTGYGWKKLLFPGCEFPYGVNAGARGPTVENNKDAAGAMVRVGASDLLSSVSGTNAAIQSSLRTVRPYGGTPTAAMLDDLRYYLKNEDGIRRGSDPYYTCRERYGVLLTDGSPDDLFRKPPFNCEATNCDGGQPCVCPYEKSEEITRKLIQDGDLKKLWVVAFSADQDALNELNVIAQRGDSERKVAIQASTAAELADKLYELMQLTEPNSTSRSVPVVVNAAKPVLLGGMQYEITAGLARGEDEDDPWEGRLYRRRIGCDGAAVSTFEMKESDHDIFHVELDKTTATSRQLYTVRPTTSAKDGTLKGSAISDSWMVQAPVKMSYHTTPSNVVHAFTSTKITIAAPSDSTARSSFDARDSNVLTAQKINKVDDQTRPDYFSDTSNITATEAASRRDRIHDYLYGIESKRAKAKLGDIFHSNPVVMPPVPQGADVLRSFDPRLRKFYTDLTTTLYPGESGRPGVVFVGSNDGILHAFLLDTYKKGSTTYHPGHELWGFVPPSLFGKMWTMVQPTHTFMFDGTPVVQEVLLNGQVRSVLVAGVRGTPSYIALDVTEPDPEKPPTFLWQRAFSYLGNTVGMPAIGHVMVKWNEVDMIRSVAILPGGEGVESSSNACPMNEYSRGLPFNAGTADDQRSHTRCWHLRGRSLYVVDLATGALIQEFDGRHLSSPLTGSVAVDSGGLALTRAAYMTDADGVLWRLSMRSSDPSNWRLAPIHDIFSGQARDLSGTKVSLPTQTAPYASGRVASYPPLVTQNAKTGRYTIVVGTGNADDLTDEAAHRIVSLEETRKLDGSELASDTATIYENWKIQLDAGESVTGPLSMLNEVVYFTTFDGPAGKTNADLCEIGTSRLWGAHVREAVVTSTASTQGPYLPRGELYSQREPGTRVLAEEPKDEATAKSLLLGISVARNPVCMVGSGSSDVYGGTGRFSPGTNASAGEGGFTLRSLVAGSTSDKLEKIGTDKQAIQQFKQVVAAPANARSVGWASSIE